MARTKPTVADLDNIPAFVRRNRAVRANIKDDSFPSARSTEWRDVGLADANLLTSKSREGWNGAAYHKPMIDIDFPAALLPSSTPGHFHLYLDKEMSWDNYKKLLNALYQVGIIQYGVLMNALDREATSLRLPWIKKDNPDDNKLEATEDEYRVKLKAQIEALQRELDSLDDPF